MKGGKASVVRRDAEAIWGPACSEELRWTYPKWKNSNATTTAGARHWRKPLPALPCSVLIRSRCGGSDYPEFTHKEAKAQKGSTLPYTPSRFCEVELGFECWSDSVIWRLYPSDLRAVHPGRPAPHCAGSDLMFTVVSSLLTLLSTWNGVSEEEVLGIVTHFIIFLEDR